MNMVESLSLDWNLSKTRLVCLYLVGIKSGKEMSLYS